MRSGRIGEIFIAAWFLIGLYSPSSVEGDYSNGLWVAWLCLLAAALLLLLFRKDGFCGASQLINSLLLVAILLAATVFSPFPEYRWGGLLPYVVLALLFAVNLRRVSGGHALRIAVKTANVANIAAGAAVILRSDAVSNFLVTHYSTFYPELVAFMTESGKPVLTFGSHSTSAFFYYLLFLINLEAYKVSKSAWSLIFAACYIVLGFAVFSTTGLLLMSVATLQVLFHVTRRNWKLTVAVSTGLFLSAAFIVDHYVPDFDLRSAAILTAAQGVATSDVSGFSGRFSEFGTLYSTLNYLKSRPFSPVGLGYRSDLLFGDSGPVEYYLRGSVFLVLCVYGGLLAFLHKNLQAKTHAWLLFFAILAFENGFTALTYVRSLYLLPILVVYLNDLTKSCGSTAAMDAAQFASA